MSSRTERISELINEFIKKTISMIKSDIKINNGDVIQLVTYVMELVEKSPLSLTSEEKLYVAVEVINGSIDQVPNLTDEDKRDIKLLVSNTIEIIVEASKGRFSFGKNKKKNDVEIDTVKLTEQIYDRVKKLIKDKKYDAKTLSKNIFIILTQVMSMVDEYPSLTGAHKKAIVLAVFAKLVDEIDIIYPEITDDDKQLIRTAVVFLSPMIEQIINGIKGNIDINQVKNKLVGCFKRCCKKE